MIFRRYGTSYQSVDMDFDAKALNDVAFRRNRLKAIPVDELESSYVTVKTVELVAVAQGMVQYQTKQDLLDRLQAQIEELQGRLPDGGILVVENEQGHDYPKTRQQTKNVVEEGENRLYFDYSMAPPLRVSVRQPAS